MSDHLSNFIWSPAPIITLHDRPAPIYQELTPHEKGKALRKLPHVLGLDAASAEPFLAENYSIRTTKLIVSSTSWTPDEDFSILLTALKGYSRLRKISGRDPELLVIITGKGPLKSAFEQAVSQAESQNLLQGVQIKTIYFDEIGEYAKILACADLGVSLHTSSSGVDKVFGDDPRTLVRIKQGAQKEGKHRWDDEWDAQAGKLSGLLHHDTGS